MRINPICSTDTFWRFKRNLVMVQIHIEIFDFNTNAHIQYPKKIIEGVDAKGNKRISKKLTLLEITNTFTRLLKCWNRVKKLRNHNPYHHGIMVHSWDISRNKPSTKVPFSTRYARPFGMWYKGIRLDTSPQQIFAG